MRDTLFGDMPIERWVPATAPAAEEPWASWHRARAAIEAGRPDEAAAARTVLGVVIEVDVEDGLDLLAAYADRSARYYSHGGGAIVWERPDVRLDMLTPPAGLFFGEGPASLMADPLAAPGFDAGLALMLELMRLTGNLDQPA